MPSPSGRRSSTASAALMLYLTLPHSLIMGRKGLVPAVEGVLPPGLVITTPRRHHHQPSRLRAVVVALLALVSLSTLVSLILLARFLLDGSRARGHALLFAGAVLWLTNVPVFGIGIGTRPPRSTPAAPAAGSPATPATPAA